MFGLRMLRAVRQGRTQDVAMLGVMVPMNQMPGVTHATVLTRSGVIQPGSTLSPYSEYLA